MVMPTVAVLTVAGLQVPVMGVLLVELPGKFGAAVPWQTGPIAANVGVIDPVISISKVVVKAHCPALGVKV